MARASFHIRIGAIGLLLLAGCETTPITPVIGPGPIAVVPALYAPETNFNLYARGKGTAAGELGVKGAAGGAAAGAVLPLGLGPYGVAAYPIIAPFTILTGLLLGGVAGASYGAINGLSTEQVQQVDNLVGRAVHQIGVHEQVARRLVEPSRPGRISMTLLAQSGPRDAKRAKDYAELKQTYRAVLELAVDRVGMAARKGDPPRIALEMHVRARVVCLAAPCVSGERDAEWAGKPRSIKAWQAGGAALLEAEFEQAYETLSQYVREWFLDAAAIRGEPP